VVALLRLRRRKDLDAFDETSAYSRCHERQEQMVRRVYLPPRRARYDLLATGERLRRRFEERLDAREGDGTAEPGSGPR
jgi:hypothetical protein